MLARSALRAVARRGAMSPPLACVLALCLAAACAGVGRSAGAPERFSEELLLRPLRAPAAALSAALHLEQRLPPPPGGEGGAARFPEHFPRAALELLRAHGVRRLELALTKGRWDGERWGAATRAYAAAGGKEGGVGCVCVLGGRGEGRHRVGGKEGSATCILFASDCGAVFALLPACLPACLPALLCSALLCSAVLRCRMDSRRRTDRAVDSGPATGGVGAVGGVCAWS